MTATDNFVELPVIDLAFEFVGAPGQQFTLRPYNGDFIRLSTDRSRYVIKNGPMTVRVERRNVVWFESHPRVDKIPLTGSPMEMLQQKEALLRGVPSIPRT